MVARFSTALLVLGTALAWLAGLSPEDAQSNLSKWFEKLGFPAYEQILTPAVDTWAFAIGAALIGGGMVWLVGDRVVSRLERRKEDGKNLRRTTVRGDGEIRPRDTVTEHGILTLGPDGYPSKLTSWERMRAGELAPPPASSSSRAAPPRQTADEPIPFSRVYEIWSREPRNGRQAARLIMRAPSTSEAWDVLAMFCLAGNRVASDLAYFAMFYRVHDEGGEEEGMDRLGEASQRVLQWNDDVEGIGMAGDHFADPSSQEVQELISLYKGDSHWRQ